VGSTVRGIGSKFLLQVGAGLLLQGGRQMRQSPGQSIKRVGGIMEVVS
jgi:uncharacterized membrane protein